MKTLPGLTCAALLLFWTSNSRCAVLYVDVNNANPASPFDSWTNAASNIQDAIDTAAPGDTVLVTNGIYRTGGRVVSGVTNACTIPFLPGPAGLDVWIPGPQTNRVAIRKAIIVQSVNGPNWTIIEGFLAGAYNSVRCAYLTNGATLTGFTLTNGAASAAGGGVWCLSDNAFVSNCIVVNNQAAGGGGVFSGTVENCILLNNHGFYEGGGALASTLNNSVLTGNVAGGMGGGSGGGAWFCVLNSCTVVSNIATASGSGVSGGTLNNCIVYDNPWFGNYDTYFYPILNYCCTTPMPTNGVGNITNDPAFVNPTIGDFHLQAISPCINTGNNSYVTNANDLDGNGRIVGGTVDMGAYEYQAPIRCVNINNTTPAAPYTSWFIAAANIQDAIDAAIPGDTVLVTNGIYRTGGRVVSGVTNAFSGWYLPGTDPTVPGPQTNRVAIRKAIIVQSVNGPKWTIIEGAQGVRCAYLTNGATLSGFTLTNGGALNWYSLDSGGGAWCLSDNAFLSNCIVVNNQAAEGGGFFSGTVENCILLNNHGVYEGGGALASTLNNSVLTGNVAGGGGGGSGGGASLCVLNSCTVVSNIATASGSGVSGGTLNNCIVYNNPWFGNYDTYFYPTLNYCCTTPMPTNGVGNITNEPAFVNPTIGDFHLQAISPCINTGNNAAAVGSTDLDGNPRIMGGTVDMGAFEYQAQVTGTFSNWLQQYNLPTDGSADYADSDGTGMANWQKWIAGLNPTNTASVLAMLTPAFTNSTGVTVRWQSVTDRVYYVQRSTSVAAPFITFGSNILGQKDITAFTDTNAAGLGPFFYRIGVQ
jgi:hypothetical protein